jgi:hypothetical protein
MRTDDGRIDHLQRGVRHSASREPFQDHVPDATVGPPPKLPKDRVPVAEALRQVAPRCAGSHQPKHRVEHAAMIAWRPAAAAMDQERFEVRPLIVGHQSANQGCPPQRAALNQFAILASIGLSTRPNRNVGMTVYVRISRGPYQYVDGPRITPGGRPSGLRAQHAIRRTSFHVLPDGCIRDDEVQFRNGVARTRHIMPQPSTSTAHPHCCA